MSPPLSLAIRTPLGLLYEGSVRSIRAEDLDGGFGILPGRRDLAAALPPGLVLFEDAEGDGYVAVSGGVLELTGGACRVMAPEAELARDPTDAAERLVALRAARRERSERRRGVLFDLEREALRRLANSLREPA